MTSTIVLEKETPIESTDHGSTDDGAVQTVSLPEPISSALPLTESTPESSIAIVFTVETMLWLLLGAVALGMRVISLAYWPLSESEAALAHEAWRFVSGESYDMGEAGLSPLAFNLDALLFVLFGANDGVARVAQALAGTALVLSPWWLRPIIGRRQALAMSALLLISPSVLFWSRQASGEVWAALCALLLVAGVARWWQSEEATDGILASLALGIGLASGAGFWSVLLAGLLFFAWQRQQSASKEPEQSKGKRSKRKKERSNQEQEEPIEESEEALPEEPIEETIKETPATSIPSEALEGRFRAFFMRYGLITLLAFIISATGFLTNLQGLGAAFNLPIQWLMGIFGVGPTLVLPFFFVLLLYELLMILLGVIGGIRLKERLPRLALFSALWIAVTLLPTSLTNSGWAAAILFITLPMTLLGSVVITDITNEVLEEGTWDVEGLLLGLGLGMFLYFWINISSYIATPSTPKLLASTIVPIGSILAATFIIANYQDRKAALRALSLTLLILLTIASFSTSWGLSLVRANDAREPLVVQPSDANLRTAAAQLGQISIERYRNPGDIAVGIQQTLGYAPRWYFRNFDNVTLIDGSHAGLPEAALLDSQQPPPPRSIGQRVWLGTDWQWPITEARYLMRWLKTRHDPAGLIPRSAVLYVMLP